MALVDASTSRRVLQAWGPVKITLAGTVAPGDPIKYSTGWKVATNESGKPAILIAGQSGVSDEIITAYVAAIVELTHTAANVPTMGQIIAVADSGGLYTSASAGLQDIGYIMEIGSDSLTSSAYVSGVITELDTAGT